ncbi:MAG TPA: group I intron-associated PD-(D/E)XK endonuclease [Solirubrobacterales bacterium]|nr:group I intron-associated PD-(D/E)XK endonuclease [Solirubrobacterales bacterium]
MPSVLPKPELTSHPVDVGHRAEAAILSELVKRGYRVLLPFGVNQRYDLVLDCEGRFLKAQCKTGRLREGVIQCSTQSIQSNTRSTRWRSYTGEVDLFIVYCPQNDSVYVIPADEVPSRGNASSFGFAAQSPGQARTLGEGLRVARLA